MATLFHFISMLAFKMSASTKLLATCCVFKCNLVQVYEGE